MFFYIGPKSVWAQNYNVDVSMGCPIVPGYNREITTGGENDRIVTVNTESEFTSYAISSGPIFICLKETINSAGSVHISSNKTIEGKGNNAVSSCLQMKFLEHDVLGFDFYASFININRNYQNMSHGYGMLGMLYPCSKSGQMAVAALFNGFHSFVVP